MTTNKDNKYTVLKYYNDVLKYIEDIILNINETTNIQLNKFKKYISGFIGAYSSDNIPKLKNNESCILNTQTSRQNGEHWVALIKYYNKIYFMIHLEEIIKNYHHYGKLKIGLILMMMDNVYMKIHVVSIVYHLY